MKKNIYSGDNFKWLMIHIDDLFMTMTLTQQSTQCSKLNTLGRLIYLMAFYLKNETKLSYKKAALFIEEGQLKKLIILSDVIEEGDNIRIPLGDKNWNKFINSKRNSSKGGKTKAKNELKTKMTDEQEVIKRQEYEDIDEDNDLPFG